LPSPEPPPPFLFAPFPFLLARPFQAFKGCLSYHSTVGIYSEFRLYKCLRWVGFDDSPLEVSQGMAEGNMNIASKFVDVISGQARGEVSMRSFRDADSLVAGNLQNHFPAWELIANIATFDLTPKILLWIKNCVDMQDFFQSF